MDLTTLTIKDIQTGYQKKQFSCPELVQAYLDRINDKDKNISAFISAFGEETVKQAEAADINNQSNKLSGIPYAVKDNILVKDKITTAGSQILKNYQAGYQATAIDRLQEEGALVLGKTNLDEFGMGASCEQSGFFPTKNPWNTKKVPGGSSGGSAAAVAASFCPFALGSDTGGSIRQPASFCGVVGLKPTYGRVSRYGLIALASSLDQIGPLTKNVEDAALVLQAIAGSDPHDSTSNSYQVEDFPKLLNQPIKGTKIGLVKEYFQTGLDNQVKEVIEQAVNQLGQLGAEIKEVSLPDIGYALPVYYILMSSEASANLARYDGIRFGQNQEAEDLLSQYRKNKAKGFGPEVKRRIMLGTYSLSAGYYDQYYHQAKKVQKIIQTELSQAFSKFDLLVGPTAPTTAFALGEKISDPLQMYLSDIYTVSANIGGLPAISLPVGLAGGLPVGMQLMADKFQESKILSTARQLEQQLDLKLNPPL